MHKLYEKACDALMDLEHSDRVEIMRDSDRRVVSELVDLKKNILKVWKLESEGYGTETEMESRTRAHDEVMAHLQKAHDAAPDEETRLHTRELMDKLRHA